MQALWHIVVDELKMNENTEDDYYLNLKTALTITRKKYIQVMEIYEETTGLNVNKKVLLIHSYCGCMKTGHQGRVIQDALSMLG